MVVVRGEGIATVPLRGTRSNVPPAGMCYNHIMHYNLFSKVSGTDLPSPYLFLSNIYNRTNDRRFQIKIMIIFTTCTQHVFSQAAFIELHFILNTCQQIKRKIQYQNCNIFQSKLYIYHFIIYHYNTEVYGLWLCSNINTMISSHTSMQKIHSKKGTIVFGIKLIYTCTW